MKEFWERYKGAIIGGVIALVILGTELAETLMALAIVIVAVCLGNYVQKNKEEVKEKLKELIDKF